MLGDVIAVGVKCQREGAVPQPFRYLDKVSTRRKPEHRKSMPEIVQTNP